MADCLVADQDLIARSGEVETWLISPELTRVSPSSSKPRAPEFGGGARACLDWEPKLRCQIWLAASSAPGRWGSSSPNLVRPKLVGLGRARLRQIGLGGASPAWGEARAGSRLVAGRCHGRRPATKEEDEMEKKKKKRKGKKLKTRF